MTPTSDEIRHQLKRLLSSNGFSRASRLSRFLQFVVNEALKGESDRLKEYVLGVEVFDRDAQYDPRVDSIVRVEASRLRTKIQEYYSGPGCEDAVIINLPKGGYSPEFVLRELSEPQLSPDQLGIDPEKISIYQSKHRVGYTVFGMAFVVLIVFTVWQKEYWPDQNVPVTAPTIRIAVLSFRSSTNDDADLYFASRLTQKVTAELVRIGSLAVVPSSSALQFKHPFGSLQKVAKALRADLLLEASLIKDGENIRVETRIIAGAINQKFLVRDGFVGRDLDELARRIAVVTTDTVHAKQQSGHLPPLLATQK